MGFSFLERVRRVLGASWFTESPSSGIRCLREMWFGEDVGAGNVAGRFLSERRWEHTVLVDQPRVRLRGVVGEGTLESE